MFPHNALVPPAAVSMSWTMAVVVVFPLVPVTTTHRLGRPYLPEASRRQANSTSPQMGSPACTAACTTGAEGPNPGLTITRS
ncbi:Uncharacterised protein [Mycobacteroides abscessus subsp. abscessus]|nr:Uncharacterised protein [Mycobacteroides abscessus subsp. abscessus]